MAWHLTKDRETLWMRNTLLDLQFDPILVGFLRHVTALLYVLMWLSLLYNCIPSLWHIFAAISWLLTLLSHRADSRLKYFLPYIGCWTVVCMVVERSVVSYLHLYFLFFTTEHCHQSLQTSLQLVTYLILLEAMYRISAQVCNNRFN
jgi:hypothetical protein